MSFGSLLRHHPSLLLWVWLYILIILVWILPSLPKISRMLAFQSVHISSLIVYLIPLFFLTIHITLLLFSSLPCLYRILGSWFPTMISLFPSSTVPYMFLFPPVFPIHGSCITMIFAFLPVSISLYKTLVDLLHLCCSMVSLPPFIDSGCGGYFLLLVPCSLLGLVAHCCCMPDFLFQLIL